MNSSRSNLQIKGIGEGILVTLGEGTWEELQDSLLLQVEEQSNFFHGAKLAINVGDHALRAAELGSLRDHLSGIGISLWAVLSNSATTDQTSQDLGLAIRLSTPKPEKVLKTVETLVPGEEGLFLQRTLRSGMKIASHGHITIMGDVNPGAEVDAVGDVLIWGKCRGVVHAGSDGNDQAVVCALELSPTQLRIADIVAVFGKSKGKPQPEIAKVVNGQVVIELWNKKGR